ncbi:MAG: RNA-binding protein [Ruminiclostridium sp.]|nr:RNA-binding protein [Ruminiclostridium sp.]
MKELSVRENIEKRLSDLCFLSEKQCVPKFTAFLNEQEQYFADAFMRRGGYSYTLWGGAECCVRKMLCVVPYEYEPEFPIFPITLTYKKEFSLGHRDFLGSFMSLGIGREQIGDILTGEGYAVVFCTQTSRDMILNYVSKIGRVGVDISEGINKPLPKTLFEEVSAVVASMRADCIVSAVTGLSREKAADFIKSGSFTLNYEICNNVSKILSEGDIISLRGYGKMVLTDNGAETKKGRLRITLKKYS